MPAFPTILRVPRTDYGHDGECVLVNVAPLGSEPLDLKLVATEHEHLYHARIQDAHVQSLQASSFSGSLDDWKALLRRALLKERSEDVSAEAMQGLETVAAITDDVLTLTIRQNIHDITLRLGAVKFQQDDEREEIAFPEWVDAAVAASDDLRQQLDTLQASAASHQDQVIKLSNQLDELIKAKQESEQDLLTKFAALLNSKKLKIRDQQRLLAGAKLDPTIVDALDHDEDEPRSRRADASRKGKRKVTGIDDDKDDEMSDVADGLDVDDDDDDDDESMGEQETPTNSDVDSNDDEDSDDQAFHAPAPIPSRVSSQNRSSTANPDIDELVEHEQSKHKSRLPFNSKEQKTQVDNSPPKHSSEATSEVNGSDEDEETEDEL
ncbi:Hypothetical protein R9X50_00696500 [Acrodontium crateriforme]|uniref:XRCC4 coiled-coil domain-containing protein n=1 Tax=Acrodontium crateriforme TaxID=150365 RepID=A0AAQ3RCG6_9PEZI|nr:Hypothetical protein R9X50_00696500 [Acrodontium crateriforme]